MSHTRIKICGITREEDAVLVAAAGADAIGLVFYPPSPRCVDIESAARIVAALPPFVSVVALFVNASRQQVEEVVQGVAIDVLQFHGDESPAYCQQFARPWMKALRVKPGMDIPAIASTYQQGRGILLDAWQEGVPGGTGKTFDWSLAGPDIPLPVVLAGGLNPVNIAQAMARLQPAAVDVSGGVEASPGVKDPEKVRQFVRQVRLADHS